MLSKVSLTIFTTIFISLAPDAPKLWFAFKSFFDNIYNNVSGKDNSLIRLWFAFKSFFDNIYNNVCSCQSNWKHVVICFQKFLWQYLQQFQLFNPFGETGCDLLSKVSLTIFTTMVFYMSATGATLWFAFKSFFDNIYNNLDAITFLLDKVVICFQKFLWQYLQQSISAGDFIEFRCDLLSKVSLTIFTTIGIGKWCLCLQLWFAFKSFFDNIYNNIRRQYRSWTSVVICFQKFLWQYLQQFQISIMQRLIVVICFQKFLWQYLQQYFKSSNAGSLSCDLLSKVSLTIFTTIWYAYVANI